ncbi:MAG: hypothetical protein HY242_01285 [Afipia sp.]|nr:hypothetical protein [Afipia sp.]
MSKIVVSTLAAFAMSCCIAHAQDTSGKVTFTIDQWRKPGSNNAGLIDITVNNANDKAITAIRLRCDYMAKTGKKVEAEQTIPLKLAANAKKTFKKTKFPYIDTSAADGACKIVSVAQ